MFARVETEAHNTFRTTGLVADSVVVIAHGGLVTLVCMTEAEDRFFSKRSSKDSPELAAPRCKRINS